MNETTDWPSGHGIYRVHIAHPSGGPIPIPRIGGVDSDGILYIGRSGVTTNKSDCSLRSRLRNDFLRPYGSHSGDWTYRKACAILNDHPLFRDHCIWASVIVLKDNVIDRAERAAIRAYFERFGELPPCNSAFPGKWDS